MVHLKRNILSFFPHKEKKNIAAELGEVIKLETKSLTPIQGFNNLCTFVDKYITKYPRLKRFKELRNTGYFTYLEYPKEIQRMIYSTNWIERLNRDYKRVLKMRGAMPTAESVIALMGTVAMEKENTTYSYSISVFKNIEELKIRDEKYTLFWTLPAPWKNMALSICNGNSAPRLKTSTITYQEAWERLQSLIDTYHNIVDILKSI